MDVPSCIDELYHTCGASQASAVAASVAGTTFGDTCGGHASPYHFHVDLSCEYGPSGKAATQGASHSPLIGIAFDGRGIYGVWEGAGAAPVLDACNGHVGPVPGTHSANDGTATSSYDSALSGMPTVPTTAVYHFHLSNSYPFTIGCFASAAMSYAACAALYPGCGSYMPAAHANGSAYFYDNWCPCGNVGGVAGASPAVPIGALPSTPGAVCYADASATAPAATGAATSACAASMLTAWSAGSGAVSASASAATPAAGTPAAGTPAASGARAGGSGGGVGVVVAAAAAAAALLV
jgi:hypothetical protein